MTTRSNEQRATTSAARSWMLYGAAGHTGVLIAQHAHNRGHRPVLAGRNERTVTDLAERLDLPWRTLAIDEPAALNAALADVDLVLNAAGPFLHTATPVAEACLDAGVHYLDISNELQVFRSLYDLHERAQLAGIAIIPGVGFGVIATNCLARTVSDAVGGARHVAVATRIASTQSGPGAAATIRDNLSFGGWIRRNGQLEPLQLGSGTTTIAFPDGLYNAMPVPTGDLEAAFHATGAEDVIAYSVTPDPDAAPPATPDPDAGDRPIYPSYGWARAIGHDGATAELLLQTGDSYLFTAAASTRAVEETLSNPMNGALSPAAAFGSDFDLSIEKTSRVDIFP